MAEAYRPTTQDTLESAIPLSILDRYQELLDPKRIDFSAAPDPLILGIYPATPLISSPDKKRGNLLSQIQGLYPNLEKSREEPKTDGAVWILIRNKNKIFRSVKINKETYQETIKNFDENDEVLEVYYLPEAYSEYQDFYQLVSKRLFAGENPSLAIGYYKPVTDALRATCMQVSIKPKIPQEEQEQEPRKIFDRNLEEALKSTQEAKIKTEGLVLTEEEKHTQITNWTTTVDTALQRTFSKKNPFNTILEGVRSRIQSVDEDPYLRQLTSKKALGKMILATLGTDLMLRLADGSIGLIPVASFIWDLTQSILGKELFWGSENIRELFAKKGIFIPRGVFKGGRPSQIVDTALEALNLPAEIMLPGSQEPTTIPLEIIAQVVNW